MTKFDRLLNSKLSDLQFSPACPGVVIDQLPIGYGGQLSRRLLGLKIALIVDRKAIFLSHEDPPYVQSMEPVYVAKYDERTAANAPPIDLRDDSHAAPLVRFNYFDVQRSLSAEGLSVERWAKQELARKYELSSSDLAEIDGWLLSWIRFLPDFRARFQEDLIRLGVTTNTLGVHLRRGDKRVETPYVPASLINSAISTIYQKWQFTSIFVASDDPQADSAIVAPMGVDVIFDRAEKRYNNANHKMLMANPTIAAQETYVAFKNLQLLASCGGIVGQDNAHFAAIAGSHILYRDGHPDRIILLDGNIARKESSMIKLQYFIKLRARAMARQLLPAQVVRVINRMTN
ncbi:hypothetical protein [Bradyrhizobium sp. WYCCWR 12699]|uniref:hypothetical protein n=1 Tax=Bradyrhizobium sp. WYCCWR 12699 TaxID=3064203 RepID=UPI0028A4AB6F|nr:hypothetical protein [Bradyrhizobium sp. WYCCWR 12699]MDT4743659.1 hypothetical protein [Bradyrhizobium sp. WYCCWR 12699]